jgi:micrococcal nuclease
MAIKNFLTSAILLLLLFSANVLLALHYLPHVKKQKEAIVVRAVDGDTIVVRFDNKTEKVRLLFIDAMESESNSKLMRDVEKLHKNGIYVKKKDMIELGKRAANYLKSLLPYQSKITLETWEGKERDKYGRLLALVYDEGKNINLEMVKEGYARAYFLGYVPQPEKILFSKAEEEAKARKSVIWKVLNE